MKKLLIAAMLLSPNVVMADYAVTRWCETVAKNVLMMQAEVVSGRETEESVVQNIIYQGRPLNNAIAINLATFSEVVKPLYSTPLQKYYAAREACLNIMLPNIKYGVDSVMITYAAKDYYSHRGW